MIVWLLFDVSDRNGVNPLDFIRKQKQLSSSLTNLTNYYAKNNLYCLALKNIKLYYAQILSQMVLTKIVMNFTIHLENKF